MTQPNAGHQRASVNSETASTASEADAIVGPPPLGSPDAPAVDRILHALTHVGPAPGLEARLLARLEAGKPSRAGSPISSSRWLRFFGWQSLAPATAVLLLLLTAALLITHPFARKRGNVARNSAAVSGSRAAPKPSHAAITFTARSTQPGLIPSPDLPQKQSASLQSEPQAVARKPTSMLPGPATTTVGSVSPAGARSAKGEQPQPVHLEATLQPAAGDPALADFYAPSHPAPRLPPTAQERLVLLMLRRGERHDLAQLDRGQRAAFEQQEDLARQDFFDPPPPPKPNLPGAPQ